MQVCSRRVKAVLLLTPYRRTTSSFFFLNEHLEDLRLNLKVFKVLLHHHLLPPNSTDNLLTPTSHWIHFSYATKLHISYLPSQKASARFLTQRISSVFFCSLFYHFQASQSSVFGFTLIPPFQLPIIPINKENGQYGGTCIYTKFEAHWQQTLLSSLSNIRNGSINNLVFP